MFALSFDKGHAVREPDWKPDDEIERFPGHCEEQPLRRSNPVYLRRGAGLLRSRSQGWPLLKSDRGHDQIERAAHSVVIARLDRAIPYSVELVLIRGAAAYWIPAFAWDDDGGRAGSCPSLRGDSVGVGETQCSGH